MKFNTKWEKIQQEKILMRRNTMSDHLVVGHNFVELFQKSSDYYVGFGRTEDKLVALLPINDMGTHSYYATGEGFSAVFLINDGQRYADDGCYSKVPEYQKFKEEYPVILYFLGHDDGSYGKQFKTEEEALDFLKNVTSFDSMVDSHDGPAIYETFIKQKEKLSVDELEFIFKNSLLYIN